MGRWTIHRKGGAWLYAPFYWDDWFHSLLNAPTRRIFVLLFIVYLLAVVTFAFAYLSISTSGQEGDDVVGGGESCLWAKRKRKIVISFRVLNSFASPPR